MKKRIRNIFIILIIAIIAIVYYKLEEKQERKRAEYEIRMSPKYKGIDKLIIDGNIDEALNTYSYFIDKYPDQEWLLVSRGDLYSNLEEYSLAIQDYSAIEDPGQLSIGARQKELRIAKTYMKMGKTDSAIYFYEKIAESKTENDKYSEYDYTKQGALGSLGKYYYNKKDFKKSLTYYNRAIEIKRTSYDIYLRANVYYSLGEKKLAFADYHESIPLIRKLFINKHPYYKDILCESCGPNFGTFAYTDVLKNWRTLKEQISERNKRNNLIRNKLEYSIMIDSLPRWINDLDRLKKEDLSDPKNINRIQSLTDSVRKYSDTTFTFNSYEQ